MTSFANKIRQTGMHRSRLMGAAAFGIVAFFVLPEQWTITSRILIAWNIALWPYLAAIGWLMVRTSAQGVRGIAKQEDASSAGLLVVMCSAAVLSLAAIVVELARKDDSNQAAWFVYGITLSTVVGSWLLIGALYTFHYAHMYYSSPEHRRPLSFPDGLKSPSYVDFMYFALTLSVAVQTSDVSVHTTAMRATVIAQCVLCFFFNLAILGLSINIAAGFVGSH